MSIKEFFKKNSDSIIQKWIDSIVRTYDSDTSRFLTSQKDQFANPVGYAIRQTVTECTKLLADGISDEVSMYKAIDPLIRIRAVQDLSASKALSVIFAVKPVVREIISKNQKNYDLSNNDLSALDEHLDKICLAAFDVYMGCREQIYSFKASHVKDRTKKLLEKAGLLAEVPEVGTEIMSHEAYKMNFGNN